jgi:hypothetical protein
MLAGFLLLKLPVATMINGSVSLAGQNGFSGALEKKEERKQICKLRQDVQNVAGANWPSPATPFPKERSSLSGLSLPSPGAD